MRLAGTTWSALDGFLSSHAEMSALAGGTLPVSLPAKSPVDGKILSKEEKVNN